MTAIQTELFSIPAENLAAPLSDWDWENQHRAEIKTDPSDRFADRSFDEIRSAMVTRAQATRSKKLGTIPQGTIPQQSPTDSQELGTIPTVPNRQPKYALSNMYQDWHKSRLYWKMKPYVAGKRKTFHLHENYDRAVAIGKKILAKLEVSQ